MHRDLSLLYVFDMTGLEFTVNGRTIFEEAVPPTTTLLNYLRDQLGLTGTKEGCAEGDCGACTVAVVDPDSKRFSAVNACLILLPMVNGKDVITVEGLKSDGQHHPVQQALVEALGSQCGYCTPGIVMSMFEACYREDLDDPWKLDDQMCGNLCRCTGYRPIRDAARQVAGLRPPDRFLNKLQEGEPTELVSLSYQREGQRFWAPVREEELWALLEKHPKARFVAGGTDLSLEVTKRFETPELLISLESLPSLKRLEVEADGHLHIGSGVSLAALEEHCQNSQRALARILRFFGARQIKNRGTVGGNLCTASPIGDLAPVLISLGAQVLLLSAKGRRELPLERFFLDYRKTALAPGEIMEAVLIPPRVARDVRSTSYKVSKRQELDISTVSCGLYVELEDGAVKVARFAFGGMAAIPARASAAEAAVLGKRWSEEAVEAAALALAEDFQPIDDHRGSAWYRRTVAANLLRGFFWETQKEPEPKHSYRPTGTIAPEGAQEVTR